MAFNMEGEDDAKECGLDEETLLVMESKDDMAALKDKYYLHMKEDKDELYGGVFVLLKVEEKEGQISAKILQHKMQKGSQSDVDKLETFLTKGGAVQDVDGVQFRLVGPLLEEKDFPVFESEVDDDSDSEVDDDSDSTESQHSEQDSEDPKDSQDGAASATSATTTNEASEAEFMDVVDELLGAVGVDSAGNTGKDDAGSASNVNSASNKGKGKAKD